jgi:hypothetical protein
MGRRPRDWLLSELAAAVKKLRGGPDGVDDEIDARRGDVENDESGGGDVVALLLSKACTKSQIQLGGYKALPGVDNDRFELLLKVNTLLSAGKQLKFYIAQLQSSKPLGKENVTDSVFWYSIRGEKMGARRVLTKRLNFVNPDEETLEQIWSTGDRNSWQGVERFAVVMWPSSADITNALTVMDEADVYPSLWRTVTSAPPLFRGFWLILVGGSLRMERQNCYLSVRNLPGPSLTRLIWPKSSHFSRSMLLH